MNTNSVVFRKAREFRDDTGGVFAIAFAIASIGIMLATGLAIDGARMFAAKSQLSSALDAAVTSTTRDITTGAITAKDAEDVVEQYVAANLEASSALTGRLTIDSVDLDPLAKSLSVSAHYKFKPLFPFFRNVTEVQVAGLSAATYSDRVIELAMMLDVTGSMDGQKLKDLKKSASNAVDILTGRNRPGDERIRIAIVPYANAVNTGNAGRLAETVYVEKEFKGGAFAGPKHAEYWGMIPVGGPPLGSVLPDGSARPDYCATERKGGREFTDDGPADGLVSRDYRVTYCPSAAILPLTTDATKLKNTIGSFTANGYTAGHIGIQWTWYMLSNKWKDFVPAESVPAAAKAEKVAILMTDGEFNTAYAGNGNANYKQGGQGNSSSAKAKKLCKEMKKDGITVYTIGFQLDNEDARKVMADCATPATGGRTFAYLADDGDELDAAFREIARNIEKLRLVE